MISLTCMRLDQMARRHPDQDNSRACSRCGAQVGIYPSGQAVLKSDPSIAIVCNVCEETAPAANLKVLAPGAEREPFESYTYRPEKKPSES